MHAVPSSNHPQGVNVFEKDYLFVPVHNAAHWSLMVVCHPGLARLGTRHLWSGELAKLAPSQSGDARWGPTPCILHFDSIQSEWGLAGRGWGPRRG